MERYTSEYFTLWDLLFYHHKHVSTPLVHFTSLCITSTFYAFKFYVFLRTNTTHKPCITSQVLHTGQQNTSTSHTNTRVNALTSPHQPLSALTHNSGIELGTLHDWNNVYSIGRTRRETLPTTRHTSLPDFKNRTLQRDSNHTACSTSPSEYTGRQTTFQKLASSTEIGPLKMTYIT